MDWRQGRSPWNIRENDWLCHEGLILSAKKHAEDAVRRPKLRVKASNERESLASFRVS